MSGKNLSTPQTQEAWKFYLETQNLIKEQGRLFLRIGYNLKTIRDKKLYRYLGEGGFDTWSNFLENAEVSFRPQTARLYIQVYELYIDRLGFNQEDLEGIALYRLQRLMPPLREKTDTEARELVEQAREMTTRDFDLVLQGQGFTPEKPLFYRCKDCGKWKIEIKANQLCLDDVAHLEWLQGVIKEALGGRY